MQTTNLLLKLPHEVLLQIFKHYLDLYDLWTLSKVCKNIQLIVMNIIKKQWRIEIGDNKDKTQLFKIQTNISLITLNHISHKFISRIKIYDPYAYPPLLPTQHERHQQQEETNNIFPPTIEPDLDEVGNDIGFIIERYRYHSKRLSQLLTIESGLHERIIQGISEHMNEQKISYSLRAIIDIIFHHAIFVSSRDRLTSGEKLVHHSFTRTFSAATSRLLCEIQSHFRTDEMIGIALWDNMNTFMTFTEYRLLSIVKQQQHLFSNISTQYYQYLRNEYGLPLLYILYTINALFDLIGACYVAHHLKDDYAIAAIKKLCALLDKVQLKKLKKSMLIDLIDIWLNIDMYIAHSSLRSIVQDELNKNF